MHHKDADTTSLCLVLTLRCSALQIGIHSQPPVRVEKTECETMTLMPRI